ncbi:aldehyde dehydrogenase family protein [Dongshaea marina]|uniref:aldehyde dehydrogenase family protein n=1 Tax=Dongshaea marina TaxID=2047966 RepID=UPI000D3E0DFC|nr:aldehyde dehydrogenase family protein [Dongshaea marina]
MNTILSEKLPPHHTPVRNSERSKLLKTTLESLNLSQDNPGTYPVIPGQGLGMVTSIDPATQTPNAAVQMADWQQIQTSIERIEKAQRLWVKQPFSKRLSIIQEAGQAILEQSLSLTHLSLLETGKSLAEAREDVTALSGVLERMHSQATEFNPKAQPHGIINITNAFNYPIILFTSKALPALAAGNGVLLKPNEKTALTNLASCKIISNVLAKYGFSDLLRLVVTDKQNGYQIWQHPQIKMIEAVGSIQMRDALYEATRTLDKKVLAELGGANATIVHRDANLDKCAERLIFSLFCTNGQRCTNTRRLYIHTDHYETLKPRLVEEYKNRIRVGDPLEQANNVGPVFHQSAVNLFVDTIDRAQQLGGRLLIGGQVIQDNYVGPAIIEAPELNFAPGYEETFVPITFIYPYDDLDQLIEEVNKHGRGLGAALFTESRETFLSYSPQFDTLYSMWNYGTSGPDFYGNLGEPQLPDDDSLVYYGMDTQIFVPYLK